MQRFSGPNLTRRGLDGFLIPRADAHQGEYVPPHDCRLQWLTGFTGSAGLAAVLGEDAAIFVDGRYTIQVREQVDMEVFPASHLINEPVTDWLAARNSSRARSSASTPCCTRCARFAV